MPSPTPGPTTPSLGPTRRPAGVTFLSLFFFAAAAISYVTAVSLLDPEGPLEGVWRINPIAREGLAEMGGWAPALLFGVGAACALAGVGLWRRKVWGRRLALGVLTVNLIGDFANVFVRGDERALIGMPFVGLLTFYLLSGRAKRSEIQPPERPGLERRDCTVGPD